MREVAYNELHTLVGQETGRLRLGGDHPGAGEPVRRGDGDHQWIHVDVERANREMGGPIAHGYLTLSLIPFLSAGLLRVQGVTRGINYGSDKVRFTNMVRIGKRVRLRQKLVAVEPKAGGLQMKNECTIEIEGEERPACVAETISVIYGG
jgi:acyl dehydratase